MENTIAVIGGGISGLAVAHEILERATSDVEIVCLEASNRPGGNLRTDRQEGFTCEWGPNGFLDDTPATIDLVRRLGIADRLLPSNEEAAKRSVYHAGRLQQLPSGVVSFLRSDVLSVGERLRVMTEPLRRPARGDDDESVHGFATRRIGKAAAGVFVDAMVSGIYAGDAKKLSVRSAFPKLHEMEQKHGSLTRAMLARRKDAPRAKSRLTSFVSGIQELSDRLAEVLGERLRLSARVEAVRDMGVRGFRVHMSEGAPIDAGTVVLATPAWCASPIVESMDAEMSRAMQAIPTASITVVHLGFDEEELGSRPDGFGFLVPRGEGPRILGALWASSIFPMRAPGGKVLVTVMIGGAHDPEAIELPDERLVDLVQIDLGATMDVKAAPRFLRIFRHERGIPQYTLGHQDRLATIERRLAAHPGFLVCGNSYRGISLNACVEEAGRIADAALASTAARQSGTLSVRG